jgi:hypothetical protein
MAIALTILSNVAAFFSNSALSVSPLLLSFLVSLSSNVTLGISTFGDDWDRQACSVGDVFPAKAARCCMVLWVGQNANAMLC